MISGVCINSCAVLLQSPLFLLHSQDTQVYLTHLPSFFHLLWHLLLPFFWPLKVDTFPSQSCDIVLPSLAFIGSFLPLENCVYFISILLWGLIFKILAYRSLPSGDPFWPTSQCWTFCLSSSCICALEDLATGAAVILLLCYHGGKCLFQQNLSLFLHYSTKCLAHKRNSTNPFKSLCVSYVLKYRVCKRTVDLIVTASLGLLVITNLKQNTKDLHSTVCLIVMGTLIYNAHSKQWKNVHIKP